MNLSSSEIEYLLKGTTFGMELDCGEFDRHKSVPASQAVWCPSEVSSINFAGIGADPTIKYNCFGGELQLVPTNSETELFNTVMDLLDLLLRKDRVRFSTGIHMHVRIPGLLENISLLKYLVHWSTYWTPQFSEYWWDWEDCNLSDVPKEAKHFVSWQDSATRLLKTSVYSQAALRRMDNYKGADPKELAYSLHNNRDTTSWKDEYLFSPTEKDYRPAINFGHLAINGTIEFRCFRISTDPKIIKNIIEFPLQFIRMALSGDKNPLKIIRNLKLLDRRCFLSSEDTPNMLKNTARTYRYFNNEEKAKKYILIQLISKNITLADLNYPQYWINKGFQ